MAIVPLLRLVIILSPIAYRAVASSGPGDASRIANQLASFWSRITNAAEDLATLSTEMSEAEGEVFFVTDFTGSFELRKLAWRLSRAPANTVEDQDVLTFHFLKVASGAPVAWVDATDLAAIEARITTFWAAIKNNFPNSTHSDQYRWYKDGPGFYELRDLPAPPRYVPLAVGNPAIRVTEVDVAGAGGAVDIMPPQVAMTITEKCSARPHWGRFYLPGPVASLADADGRIDPTPLGTILGAAVTLYNGARADGYLPVVWSIQKPERLKKNGATLPAQSAIAFEVSALQMDNLFDVVRRRRYATPTIRTSTLLT